MLDTFHQQHHIHYLSTAYPAHFVWILQCPSISLLHTSIQQIAAMFGSEKKTNGEDLVQVTTQGYGDVEELSKPTREVDAVFGEISEDGPNYKDVSVRRRETQCRVPC